MKQPFFLYTIIVFLLLPLALVIGCQQPAAPILEFGELAADNEEAKWENELGRWKPATGFIDGEEKALTSEHFKGDTYVDVSPVGIIQLRFEWNEEGSKLSQIITSRLIGNPLGIFRGDEALIGDDGRPIAPIIQDIITDEGVINGLSFTEASELSELINAKE